MLDTDIAKTYRLKLSNNTIEAVESVHQQLKTKNTCINIFLQNSVVQDCLKKKKRPALTVAPFCYIQLFGETLMHMHTALW